VFGRFNSLIIDFILPVRPIYFPVRPRKDLHSDISEYQ
jgi:hypothetical protein